MADVVEVATTLKLTGSRLTVPQVPALLRAAAARDASGVADPFLPDDYLRTVAAYDISLTGRSSATTEPDLEIPLEPGQILVLELADGTTLITSGARFQDELRRVAPESIDEGRVKLDDIKPRGAASRGLVDSLGRLVSKVSVLSVGEAADTIIDTALAKLGEIAGAAFAATFRKGANWGASYLATQAIMAAIEGRLRPGPGLYSWVESRQTATALVTVDPQHLAEAAREGPLLLFIHGTGSYTTGCFGDLRNAVRDAALDWNSIEARYRSRIYGFEHRTFSESPIENASALARLLPVGAQIDLVTHSRGGIVGDLLCVDWTDPKHTQSLIDGYKRFRTPNLKDAQDLDEADAKDRRDLTSLVAEMRAKQIGIGRYVRVAAPVNGTLLLGANLDLFLSSLLTLFGTVTTLQGSPFYSALKRIVLEIARNRIDANRVPGIEAMLPGSALSRVLRLATPQKGIRIGVIAGDIEGASRFKRLVELLADWAIFERTDNDLVVDTASMDAGIARATNAKRQLVQGPEVDHFRYFGNAASRGAMKDWLTVADPDSLAQFGPLASEIDERRARVSVRGAMGPQPAVILLPGIMGSHLQIGTDRVWFDPLDIAAGGLAKLAYTAASLEQVTPEILFEMAYGDCCAHLERTHRVVRFPYDWRRPVQQVARNLARALRAELDRTRDIHQPVRILAHSMGGLVTRAMAAAEPALWNEFLAREGSRFVMLGTPNRGSHSMVEILLGKGAALRTLAMLDVDHDLQELLSIVAAFRGALQLLPQPGFTDAGGTRNDEYLTPKTWEFFRPQVFDFWFGNGVVGVPPEAACTEAAALWELPDFKAANARVPGEHPEKVLYVCGKADNTPCGITLVGNRVKMIGTPEGDGTVSWAASKIDGIGAAYWMNASHGDLANTEEYFDALGQLLSDGATNLLPKGWPSTARRSVEAADTLIYDAGPASVPTDTALGRSLLGVSSARRKSVQAPTSVLQVHCAAMDVLYAVDPILVGHYEQDSIAGAEASIDREVVCNELTIRKQLGLYAGAIGTATVVLLDSNPENQLRGTQRGAVVTGLGEWGELTATSLIEAVRAAAVRYLLAVVERRGLGGANANAPVETIEVGLCSVLLGYASTTNITVADSVYALVRGVLEANRQFALARPGPARARIVRLEIVDFFLDVSISATKALRDVAARLNADAAQWGMTLEVETELRQGRGLRQRLEALSSLGYWPRLIVTDATEGGDEGPVKPATAPQSNSMRAPIAERLRYVFLAQRARAESVITQRQPGLVEKLVSLSIERTTADRELSRTLFQLMVPPDFKEAARQTSALALVVDECTANMPWELLYAEDEPLIAHTAMVRQLASPNWRRRMRSTVDKTAFVVGNPSTAGFARAFSPGHQVDSADPMSLPGAEAEAITVADVLRSAGYDLVEAIGADQRAIEIMKQLFQRPHRIIHIAAHGAFDLEANDGSRRSGVLLSDGLMLTAAEIQQLEVVPDLVFLNCCHLGQIDGKQVSRGVEYHLLASSLSRQLIEMGVRAVVVAGWAVDDAAGQAFAESFYRGLVTDGLSFGRAIHQARLDTYRAFPTTNTWGAFQAYGDQGFLLDPARATLKPHSTPEQFAAPQELIARLSQIQERLQHTEGSNRTDTLQSLQREIEELLKYGPDSWRERGDVQVALASTFADFGPAGFELARAKLTAALAHAADGNRVPLKAIEDLANLEARLGEHLGNTRHIERGSARLLALTQAVAIDPTDPTAMPTAERCGLLGSAWKRRAAAQARNGKSCSRALKESRRWYMRGAGTPDTESFNPYCTLNRLMLDALLGTPSDPSLATQAGDFARANYVKTRAYWDAMMPADARLAEALLSGQLVHRHAGPQVIAHIIDGYQQARSGVREDAKSWDSVVNQIELLALLARKLNHAPLAASLTEIFQRLRGSPTAGAADKPKRRPQPPKRGAKRK